MRYAIRGFVAWMLHWLAYRIDPGPALPAGDDFFKAGGTDPE